MSHEFIALPEPYLSWYTSRVWAYTSPMEVARREPVWRCYAQVPTDGWVFNMTMKTPGWHKLPGPECKGAGDNEQ